MKNFLLALTALTTLAACSASAAPQLARASVAPVNAVEAPAADVAGPPQAHAAAAASIERVSSAPVCDIRTRHTANGMTISAVLKAGDAISGDYNLVITKSGASGSSDVNQAGPFQAARGERVTLGETELGLDRGDRFHAVLTLTNAAGRICRQELRS